MKLTLTGRKPSLQKLYFELQQDTVYACVDAGRTEKDCRFVVLGTTVYFVDSGNKRFEVATSSWQSRKFVETNEVLNLVIGDSK